MSRAEVAIYTCDRCGETLLVENALMQAFTRSPSGAHVPSGWQQVGPALLCPKHRVWLELFITDSEGDAINLSHIAHPHLCTYMASDIVQALESQIPESVRAQKVEELPKSADYREPRFMLQQGELTRITETKPKRRIQIKKDE